MRTMESYGWASLVLVLFLHHALGKNSGFGIAESQKSGPPSITRIRDLFFPFAPALM